MPSFRELAVCVVAAFAFAVVPGCGPDGPETATVEGTVTLGGEPLAEATVMFQPSNGRPSAGRTNADGHYELIFSRGREGALLGEHTVTISTFRAGDPEEGTPKIIERVPARYNVKSELKETVEAGKNVIDFNLEAKGRVADPRE